ncbi:MAG: helix-turn-helix domain-containing protein [Armatimonadota bacterium]|nr:helix-turn-helix domain-containing protein [Armatimonadota bacterium]
MSLTLTNSRLTNEYRPDEVSAPGETLEEILEERQMTQTELAQRLGLAHKTVNEIIRGKAPLTHETALGLENVLGIPASFWNTYEMAYREFLTRKEVAERLSEYRPWLNDLPWKEAVKREWIGQHTSLIDQITAILRFFGVASPEEYKNVYGSLAVQWKSSERYPADANARAFWLRRGEIEAAKLAVKPELEWNDFDQREFEQRLREIRSLTCDIEPESFVPKLQRLCAAAGVAVVFVREIDGTRASGVTFWLSPQRALIQLSLRYRTNDSLWFAFFHEAGHVLKHSKKRVFLEQKGQEMDEQEQEANQFAQNALIPPREYMTFKNMGKPTLPSVEAFAERVGVHPGIVVGRLQTDGVLRHNCFNDLKQLYQWGE